MSIPSTNPTLSYAQTAYIYANVPEIPRCIVWDNHTYMLTDEEPSSFSDESKLVAEVVKPILEQAPQTTLEGTEIIRTNPTPSQQAPAPASLKRKTDDDASRGDLSKPKGKRQRRVAVDVYLFCHTCLTNESLEWRVGPDGERTLCNACGLKYAKEQKKQKREEAASALELLRDMSDGQGSEEKQSSDS